MGKGIFGAVLGFFIGTSAIGALFGARDDYPMVVLVLGLVVAPLLGWLGGMYYSGIARDSD